MSMETIWAPWRLAYVAREESPAETQAPAPSQECFLCRYRDEPAENDRQNLVLLRGKQAFVVFNRYPYNNGHLLVTPLSHLGDLADIPTDVQAECQQLLVDMVRLLRETIRPEGFNIGLNLGRVAGAGLPGHLHWHIVPRWNGDTNFMPVVADTKVIPQSLEALYDYLVSRIKAY